MTPIRNRRTRPGFTLTEVMVGMALTLGMMVILSEAFARALEFTRSANATKVLTGHLSSLEGTLRSDMVTQNFAPQDDKPNLGRRPSDQWMHKLSPGGRQWTPPVGGYFKLYSPPTNTDAIDAENFKITSATGHYIQFTAIKAGGSESNLFTANVGGTIYSSRAAEIAYFLVPMPGNPTTGPGGVPRYNLIRRVWLVAVTADDVQALQPVVSDTDVISSVGGGGAVVNTLATLAQNPANRMPLAQIVTPGRYGDDVQASNVLSFQVLPQWDGNPFLGAPAPRVFDNVTPTGNTDGPFDYLPLGPVANPYVYDTFAPLNNPQAVTQPIRLRSVQISARIFDPNTNQSRQSTWTFDK